MSEAEDKYGRFFREHNIDIQAIEEAAFSGGGGPGSISSVFGRTGAIVAESGDYTKSEIGLPNVDNTSDINKPISTATQNALNNKETAGAATSAINNHVGQSDPHPQYALETSLSDVSISGSYADLIDTPTIPTTPGQVGAQPADDDLTAIAGLSSSNDDVIQRKSGAWTNRSIAQILVDLALDVAKISGLQAALDAKSNLASPTFTGTVTAPRIIRPPVALTDASTINTDAALGNRFRVTLGGNRTLANPTNATDGQEIIWEIIQDGTGLRTITLGSEFAFGTDITSVTLTTTADKRDFLGAVYNSTTSKWYVIAFARGY